MRLPVDTSVVSFVSAGPAEPTLDFDTKQQKIDAKGVAINQVHLFVVGESTREVITVKVAGEVRGLGQFTPVKVTDLVATTWNMARPLRRVVLGLEDRGGQRPEGLGLMARFIAIVLALMFGLVAIGFVLAHFGFVVLLVIAVVFVGRHLRRHGA